MACGATLKRNREFDPLQNNAGDRSPKRICLPIDIMSPSSHARRLNGSAFVEAAQKLIQDQLAARMSPSREKQAMAVNNHLPHHLNKPVLLPSSSSPPPPSDMLTASPPPPSDMLTASSSSPMTIPTDWPDVQYKPGSLRPQLPKERGAPLLSMKQVDIICRNIVKEHEERVRGEFNNVLANKLAEQYEGFLRFNQDQIHKRFDKSDASYVS